MDSYAKAPARSATRIVAVIAAVETSVTAANVATSISAVVMRGVVRIMRVTVMAVVTRIVAAKAKVKRDRRIPPTAPVIWVVAVIRLAVNVARGRHINRLALHVSGLWLSGDHRRRLGRLNHLLLRDFLGGLLRRDN